MFTLVMLTAGERGQAFGTGVVLLVMFGLVVAYFVRGARASSRQSEQETMSAEDESAKELSKSGPPRFNG